MSCRYCPAGIQGTVLGITFDLSVLPYLLCPFSGSSPSGRLWSVGPSWLRLRQSEKSCKQRFGASPVREAGRSRKRRWPGLPVGESGPESEASAVPSWPGLPVGEAGRSRKRAPFLFGQAFRSETGSSFWPVVRFLGRPRSCASFATSSAGPSFYWEAGP